MNPTIKMVEHELLLLQVESLSAGVIHAGETIELERTSTHDGTEFRIAVIDNAGTPYRFPGHPGMLGTGKRAAYEALSALRATVRGESALAPLRDALKAPDGRPSFDLGEIEDALTEAAKLEAEVTELRDQVAKLKGPVDRILEILEAGNWNYETLAEIGSVLIQSELGHVVDQTFVAGPK